MMIEACIWKTNPTTYNLQFSVKNNSELKQIDPFLKGWRQVGTGFSKKGDILNIFSKEFADPKLWINFAKTLPISIFEIDKDGNRKQVKTAIKVERKKRKDKKQLAKSAKQSGRTCGKCGKVGHNSRTCKV